MDNALLMNNNWTMNHSLQLRQTYDGMRIALQYLDAFFQI